MTQNEDQNESTRSQARDILDNRQLIMSLKSREDEKRGLKEKIADGLTSLFGTVPFLLLNLIIFGIWIVVNVGIVPGITPFDPFPFGFLTMVVSLEAIVLAIIVLISQNRSAKIAEFREEVDLQVDLITEREITKLLQLMTLIAEKQGIDLSQDAELQSMLAPTAINTIEDSLEQEVIGTR